MNATLPYKIFTKMNLLSEYDQFELMRIEIYLRNRRDK